MKAILKKHIDTHFPFIKGKKIAVATSGGVDSIVLSHLLAQLKFDITLLHCNFSLRGKESDADEQLVKDLGKQLNVAVFTTLFDTKKYADTHQLSIQMAARELRYEWFEKIRIEHDLDFVATAHQLDDNLETFLINLTRGTGLSGLTGIPKINDTIIRPLLPFSREEIKKFAIKNNCIWREDKSNNDIKYTRNKIRHQVIPLLKELNPSLLSSFKNTSQYLNGSQVIIADAINSLKKEVVISDKEGASKIDIEKLKQVSNPKVYLFELLKNYGFTEWNDIENLLETQSGKQIFSKTHRLVKDRDFLLLTDLFSENDSKKKYSIKKSDSFVKIDDFVIKLSSSKVADLQNISKRKIYLDNEKINFPLTIRKWKEGDYFYPLGMRGKKKLSKFFKDEKISLIDKEKIWLLCSKEQIVWIIGKRQDERFKVTSNTKKIMSLILTKG